MVGGAAASNGEQASASGMRMARPARQRIPKRCMPGPCADVSSGPLPQLWKMVHRPRGCGEVLGVWWERASKTPGPSSPGRNTASATGCRAGWQSYWTPNQFLDKSAVMPGCATAVAEALAEAELQLPAGRRAAPPRQAPEPGLADPEGEEEAPEQRHRGAQSAVQPPFERLRHEHWRNSPIHVTDACTLAQPSTRTAVGLAGGSFLLGLRLASWAGSGRIAIHPDGAVSALAAAGGCASCLLALSSPSTPRSIELSPWVILTLACLCSALTPLPLAKLSKRVLVGAAGPVRLALPGAIGLVVIFELAHRQWAQIDPCRVSALCITEQGVVRPSHATGTAPNGHAEERLLSRAYQHWWRHFIFRPGADRAVGAVFFTFHLALTYLAVHFDLALTQWRNVFLGVLQNRDLAAFHLQLRDFAPIALASMLTSVYSGYMVTLWDLRWREELTRDFVAMGLEQKFYYYAGLTGQAGVDNFDQRMVEDTAIFASSSRGLICGVAESLIRLATFGPALIRLSPSNWIWQLCLLLSVLSSAATHVVGQPLAARNAAVQRAEADLRTSLLRLRVFAEDVALQQGERAERASASHHFEDVKAAAWLAARGGLRLSSFTSAYGLVGSILPLMLLMPSYVQGHTTLGQMFQIEALVQGVRQSLDFFVGSYSEIAVWCASAHRLLALEEWAAEGLERRPVPSTSSLAITATELTLAIPGGATLLEAVSFEWREGDRVVLSGPAGSGKSTLLRAAAGACPAPASGSLLAPPSVLLVGAAGFRLPHRATLRRCLAYPEGIAAFDEDLHEALERCGLGARAAELDREDDWNSCLTLAERQRLVFARIFSRWPVGVHWLMLDDVDEALDRAAALALHEQLAACLPSDVGVVVVSRHSGVAQRPGWHRFRLDPEHRSLEEESIETLFPCTCEAPVDLVSGLGNHPCGACPMTPREPVPLT